MRKLMLALGAASLTVPMSMALPTDKVEAKKHKKRYAYREWRGRDGRTYCRKPDGTTGLVIGAVGGALIGRTIDTGGDRTAGTLLGAVGGALVGREIERSGKRCR
jgi:uncharacterized protein YcfJ